MFYHVVILNAREDVSAVVIDAEDTDVLVIVAYASNILGQDLVVYRRKKLVKCNSLYSPESVLIGFPALICDDAGKGFYRKVY